MRLVASATALGLLVSASAFAQTPPPAAPPPAAAVEVAPPVVVVTPPPPEMAAPPVVVVPVAVAPMAPPAPAKTWKDYMTVDGLVDSYYQVNFKADGGSGSTRLAPVGRAFDNQSNSFTLSYAKLGVGANYENVSFRADLGYGHTAAIINSTSQSASAGPAATPGSADPAMQLYGPAFIAQQAYASINFGQLTLDFGKFVTSASAEVIESQKNWLYSRSLLFTLAPFVHTGLRANFKVNDMVTIQGSIVNGWDNDPDNNGDKTYGLSVNITPIQPLNIVATGYFGKEGASGVAMTEDVRMLLDLVAAYTVNDKLALNLNVDFKKEADAKAFGVAAMGRFVAAEHAVLALRGELLNLDSGVPGADSTRIIEATVGFAAPFAGHYELRAEVRGDFANQDAFTTGTEATDSQFTGTVAALASF
jgi:hypothetical protein